MGKSYGVTIVKEKGLFTVEVDDVETNNIVKTYNETFETSWQAQQFVTDVVEKEFNIVDWNEKEIED